MERIYIDQENRQVFIKFTDQVSALRVSNDEQPLPIMCVGAKTKTRGVLQAVNELDGRIFNGNAIIPRFYDNERFGKGVYE